MKKHDEGYALVLVLVVVLVLNIAAVGLMTLTLNNLKTQRNLVDRMVDKYAAQGEIEKVVAQLSQKKEFEVAAEPDLKEAITQWMGTCVEGEYKNVEYKVEKNLTDDNYVGNVRLTATAEKSTIQCDLTIIFNVEGPAEGDTPSIKQHYKITPEVSYNSYQYTSGGDS